jgi:hypothetical protein
VLFAVILPIFGFGWGWLTMLINFEIFMELRASGNSFWEREIPKKEIKREKIRSPCLSNFRHVMAGNKGSSMFGVRCFDILEPPC